MGRKNRQNSKEQNKNENFIELLENLQKEIQLLKQRPVEDNIKVLNQEINSLHTSINTTYTTLTAIKEKLGKLKCNENLGMKPPTFDAIKRDHPKKFIKDLKRYIELANSKLN